MIAAVTAVGGSVVIAFSTSVSGKTPFDPLGSIYVGWLEYPVLAVGVLGVLVFTSEYSTGQIRTTFAAVPRLRAVLAVRAGVMGIVSLALGELFAFSSFFLSEAILSDHKNSLSISHPGVLGAVCAAGVSLFAIAMVGVGVGAIVRQTAGAVVALLAIIYLPLMPPSLPTPWSDRIGEFTMLTAAYQVVSLHPQPDLLSPGLSMLVLLAWPGVLLVVAAVMITRRDA